MESKNKCKNSFSSKGVFPPKYAFTLLIPLRNIFLSPKKLIHRLGLQEDFIVLEIGPGPGYFSVDVAKALKNGKLVLSDIQQEMLDYSKKRLDKRGIKNVSYNLGNGKTLDFDDESFERVFMVTVIGEVENQKEYLREIHRILKQEGILSISELAGDPDKLSIKELQELVLPVGFSAKEIFGNKKNYTVNFEKYTATFFKPQLQNTLELSLNGIYKALNPNFLNDKNLKFQKMYDWMSLGYDFMENFIGRLKYGNSIKHLRTELMSLLEWKNGISVLYVSIGTGKDIEFIPDSIDISSLNFFGLDISMGMLGKCKQKYKKLPNLTLVQASAEDLPFNDSAFDIVFHVGGINFFNDKSLAIREMLRVAKPGTKLLIADETSDYIDTQYKKSTLSKKFFQEEAFDLSSIEQAVPSNVTEQKLAYLWDKKFYALTFRKL